MRGGDLILLFLIPGISGESVILIMGRLSFLTGTKVEKVSEEDNFSGIGKSSMEMVFEISGTVRNPILVFEQNGIITVQSILFEEEDTDKLHERLLYTIVDLIQRLDPHELFVGYEGFYVMEDEAVRVLVGTLYSDDEEKVWLAQTHGRTIGEWQDVSNNPNRFGFEGLFKKAKAYRWN
jgi:hypothetical protein